MKETNRQFYVLCLGESGFPYGMAAVQRQKLMACGLQEAGIFVTVLCPKGIFPPQKDVPLPPKGTFEGVNYEYTSGVIYRPSGFLQRNFLKMKGQLVELVRILQHWQSGRLNAALVSTMRFQSLFYYYMLSRLLRFKLLLNYVEHNQAMSSRTQWKDRINDYLFDRVGLALADALLPISHFLEERTVSRTPGKPVLRIPILSEDNDAANSRDSTYQQPYLLYCGAANYLEIIDFIIRAYEHLNTDGVRLILVVNGNAPEMAAFNERVQRSLKNKSIQSLNSLPYGDLLNLYVNANALLIPLRPTDQDIARFPHKIGEYLESGTVMITTAVGEINHYFEDGKNAIISPKYEPGEFAKKIRYVLDNPELAREIGQNGKKMGAREFGYQTHGLSLARFIKSLLN